MKTIKQLFIISLLLNSFSGFSQQLANTTWGLTGTNLYYRFSNNTMSYSTNNINYTPDATYQETGNTISITDIQPSPCGTLTGSYSFQIINNIVYFTDVNEPCLQRTLIMVQPTWIKVIATNISSEAELEESSALIYPNPTNGLIHIPYNKEYQGVYFSILNQLGQTVLIDKLVSAEQAIDLSDLPKGVYYFKAEDERIKTQRIVKL